MRKHAVLDIIGQQPHEGQPGGGPLQPLDATLFDAAGQYCDYVTNAEAIERCKNANMEKITASCTRLSAGAN